MIQLSQLRSRTKGNVFSGFNDGTRTVVPKKGRLFESLFGFPERIITDFKGDPGYDEVLEDIFMNSNIYNDYDGQMPTMGGTYHPGWFIAPTIEEIDNHVKLFDAAIPKGSPTGKLIVGEDINRVIQESPAYTISQAASQFNALEMTSPNVTPQDGIDDYIEDRTQGPAVALSGFPGTFVRNYWVPYQLKKQFNALGELGLQHKNGYLIWENAPQPVVNKFENPNLMKRLRIPAQVYTQVAGSSFSGSQYKYQKLTHHIYNSSTGYNTYNNHGDLELQARAIRALLAAEYKGMIGLSLILRAMDVEQGRVKGFDEPINLTFIGGGVFENRIEWILQAIKSALEYFGKYSFRYHLHDYAGNNASAAKTHLGIDQGNYKSLGLSLEQQFAGLSVQESSRREVQEKPVRGSMAARWRAEGAEPFLHPTVIEEPPVREPGASYQPPVRREGGMYARWRADEEAFLHPIVVGEEEEESYAQRAEQRRAARRRAEERAGVAVPSPQSEILPPIRRAPLSRREPPPSDYGKYYSQLRIPRWKNYTDLLENFARSGRVSMTPQEKEAHIFLNKGLYLLIEGKSINSVIATLNSPPHNLKIQKIEINEKYMEDTNLYDFLEPLPAPDPRKLFLMMPKGNTYVVYAARDFQRDLIREIYTNPNPTGIYDLPGVYAKYVRYMTDYPVIYYINVRGEKIFVVDENLHANPDDLLRPINAITPGRNGEYILLDRIGERITYPAWIVGVRRPLPRDLILS